MNRRKRKYVNVYAFQALTPYGWRDVCCHEVECVARASGGSIATRDYPDADTRLIRRRIPTDRLK